MQPISINKSKVIKPILSTQPIQGGGGGGGAMYSLNGTYQHIAKLTHFWGRGYLPTEKVGVSTLGVLTHFRVGVPHVYFDFGF